jgi:hypothetical protein
VYTRSMPAGSLYELTGARRLSAFEAAATFRTNILGGCTCGGAAVEPPTTLARPRFSSCRQCDRTRYAA